jgi:fructose-1,6-bisphosphatase
MKVSWNQICSRQINLNIIETNYHFNYKNVSPYQKHFYQRSVCQNKTHIDSFARSGKWTCSLLHTLPLQHDVFLSH